MRTTLWLCLLFICALTSRADAQCYYYPPPYAPDMRGPGFYLYNCQGYLYGPYHIVRPPFEPFQGMLPGPSMVGAGHQGPAAYNAMPMMHPGGVPGFWYHPAVRSPRDFFMVETDPSRMDYRYGVGRGLGFGGAEELRGTMPPLGGGSSGGVLPPPAPMPAPTPAPAPVNPPAGGGDK